MGDRSRQGADRNNKRLNVYINLFLIFVLSSIVWQDFRCRKMYLVSVIFLYLFLVLKLVRMPFIDWYFISLNFIFSCIIAILIFLYCLLSSWKNFWQKIQSSIGLGELLILPLFIVFYSFANYITFLTVSFIISLLFSMISKNKIVPVAGIQGLLMIPVLILDMFEIWNPLDDLIL